MTDSNATSPAAPPPAEPKPSGSRAGRFWREWVRPVLPVVVVLLAVRSSFADWNDVPTGSMKPTILEGDRIFVNKMAYDLKIPFTGWSLRRLHEPQRGDIIVFSSPRDGTRMVKRVIGVPGDAIALYNNRLYVNGQPVDYDRIENEKIRWISHSDRHESEFWSEDLGDREHPIMIARAPTSAGRSFGPLDPLRENEFFVMGDNRDNSADSRSWGVVHRDAIAGRATRVVLSVDTQDWRPRWGRFFYRLE